MKTKNNNEKIDNMKKLAKRIWPTVLLLIVYPSSAIAQQVPDTANADTSATTFSSDGGFLLWELIGEARGFQYPIFGILTIGLFLVSQKLYDLYVDRKSAEELEKADVANMNMKKITMLVANQKQSMLADLEAAMVNVYQTTNESATLHEEIANYIQFQRDRFDMFKRRVDFLSDTAGAVGLLGTVWGMFTVFSGNIDNKEAILGGMGVALVSTLLGLVVSIILNLSSTEVYSFFDKRIDQIEDKADELRFRLMELGMSRNGSEAAEHGDVEPSRDPIRAADQSPAGSTRTSAPERISSSSRSQATPEREVLVEERSDASEESQSEPATLEVARVPESETVDSVLSQVKVRVTDDAGTPLAGVLINLTVSRESGSLDGSKEDMTVETREDGVSTFDWHLPSNPGRCQISARVHSQSGSDLQRTIQTRAVPGEPAQFSQGGNNQGAEIGDALPKPLSVHISDEYGNAVPNHPVDFQVSSGGGEFSNGEQSMRVLTDDNGKAKTQFIVGQEPGLNTVEASVGAERIKFQAMTIEG